MVNGTETVSSIPDFWKLPISLGLVNASSIKPAKATPPPSYVPNFSVTGMYTNLGTVNLASASSLSKVPGNIDVENPYSSYNEQHPSHATKEPSKHNEIKLPASLITKYPNSPEHHQQNIIIDSDSPIALLDKCLMHGGSLAQCLELSQLYSKLFASITAANSTKQEMKGEDLEKPSIPMHVSGIPINPNSTLLQNVLSSSSTPVTALQSLVHQKLTTLSSIDVTDDNHKDPNVVMKPYDYPQVSINEIIANQLFPNSDLSAKPSKYPGFVSVGYPSIENSGLSTESSVSGYLTTSRDMQDTVYSPGSSDIQTSIKVTNIDNHRPSSVVPLKTSQGVVLVVPASTDNLAKPPYIQLKPIARPQPSGSISKPIGLKPKPMTSMLKPLGTRPKPGSLNLNPAISNQTPSDSHSKPSLSDPLTSTYELIPLNTLPIDSLYSSSTELTSSDFDYYDNLLETSKRPLDTSNGGSNSLEQQSKFPGQGLNSQNQESKFPPNILIETVGENIVMESVNSMSEQESSTVSSFIEQLLLRHPHANLIIGPPPQHLLNRKRNT